MSPTYKDPEGGASRDAASADEIMGILDNVPMPAQADSAAADVATIVADFNALLAKLRAANLLTP